MNNYLKLNRDLINMVGSYTLPPIENIKENIVINIDELKYENLIYIY